MTDNKLAEVERAISQAVSEAAEAHADALRAAIDALKVHWLFEVRCDHTQETDRAICACGWISDSCPSVGIAVESWINHALLAPQPSPKRD